MMDVQITNFGCISRLSARFKPGVHLITGPSGCGRTTFCKSILWALAGGRPWPGFTASAGTSVELSLPGIGVVMRKGTSKGEHVGFIDREGVVSDNPEQSMRAFGVFPEIYRKGASCLFSNYPAEPPRIIAQYGEEIRTLREELLRLKEQGQTQDDFALHHLMESGECPLYQVPCPCKDGNVARMKEDVKSRITGKREATDFYDAVRTREMAIAEKELKLKILKDRNVDNDAEFIVDMKESLLAMGHSLGIGLSYRDGFALGGRPMELLSRSERVALTYCLQKAAEAPVIVVDDFDVLDLERKQRHLMDAGNSGKTVIFTSTSSQPRIIAGATSWHLRDGVLEQTEKQVMAR